jgi:hypothetical protein
MGALGTAYQELVVEVIDLATRIDKATLHLGIPPFHR